jgi:hypothetical protein
MADREGTMIAASTRRDHGDAECFADFPPMTLTIAARSAIGL